MILAWIVVRRRRWGGELRGWTEGGRPGDMHPAVGAKQFERQRELARGTCAHQTIKN